LSILAVPEMIDALREFLKEADIKVKFAGSYGHLKVAADKARTALTKAGIKL